MGTRLELECEGNEVRPVPRRSNPNFNDILKNIDQIKFHCRASQQMADSRTSQQMAANPLVGFSFRYRHILLLARQITRKDFRTIQTIPKQSTSLKVKILFPPWFSLSQYGTVRKSCSPVKFPHNTILHHAYSSTMTKTIECLEGYGFILYNSMGLCGNLTIT